MTYLYDTGTEVIPIAEPDWATSPGVMLESRIEDSHILDGYKPLTLEGIAQDSGIPMDVLEKILKAKAVVNCDLSTKLAKATDTPEDYWCGLETLYQADLKRLGKTPPAPSSFVECLGH